MVGLYKYFMTCENFCTVLSMLNFLKAGRRAAEITGRISLIWTVYPQAYARGWGATGLRWPSLIRATLR